MHHPTSVRPSASGAGDACIAPTISIPHIGAHARRARARKGLVKYPGEWCEDKFLGTRALHNIAWRIGEPMRDDPNIGFGRQFKWLLIDAPADAGHLILGQLVADRGPSVAERITTLPASN